MDNTEEIKRAKRREYSRQYRLKNAEKINGYQRAWRKSHPEQNAKYCRSWRHTHANEWRAYKRKYYAEKTPQHQIRAWKHVAALIAKGLLVRPGICEVCGKPQGERTHHTHHPYYSLPGLVIHCCPACHKAMHAKEHVEMERMALGGFVQGVIAGAEGLKAGTLVELADALVTLGKNGEVIDTTPIVK